jgi:hypothetical protein
MVAPACYNRPRGSAAVQGFVTASDTCASSRWRGVVLLLPPCANTEKGHPTNGQPSCNLDYIQAPTVSSST